MDLVNLKNKSYFIPGSTNIGLFKLSENYCLLVDTSYPGKKAKRLLNLLKKEKLNVKYIINTHGHIDHFGGNELLAKHFSLEVYASSYEKSFISYPDLSHSFLTSAKPLPALKTNLKGLEVKEIRKNQLEIDNNNFKIIKLPGHSRGHIGVLTPDKILFVGDAMIGPDIINQIKIPYFYDIEKFQKSLYKINDLVNKNKIKKIVPSHGKPITNNFNKAIELNIKKVQHLLEILLKILDKSSLSLEKIIVEYNKKFDINDGIPNHFITRACIMSFLSYLIEKNKVKPFFENNLLHYKLN